MLRCNIPRTNCFVTNPDGGGGCAVDVSEGMTAGLRIANAKTEIPFVSRAIAAAGTQAVAYAPDASWSEEIAGICLAGSPGSGTSSDLCDMDITSFLVQSTSYNPKVTNTNNTTTVVTAGTYAADQFRQEAFYHWSPDKLGSATPFPYGLPYVSTNVALSFTVTNNHATAARDWRGTIVTVPRRQRAG